MMYLVPGLSASPLSCWIVQMHLLRARSIVWWYIRFTNCLTCWRLQGLDLLYSTDVIAYMNRKKSHGLFLCCFFLSFSLLAGFFRLFASNIRKVHDLDTI